MPNTPALVGLGASAIAPGAHADRRSTSSSPNGSSARSASSCGVDEHQLDAVTGLSGSGPAYVFLVAEALIEAGVLVGLPRPVAAALVEQTLLGSATLLAQGEETPEALRAAVTSPGRHDGRRACGPSRRRAVRAAFLDAVAAATERSRELGRPTELLEPQEPNAESRSTARRLDNGRSATYAPAAAE